MKILKLLAIVIPLSLVLDFLWIGVLMQGFYASEMGDLLRRVDDKLAPRLLPAAMVYVFIPLGVVLFVGGKVTPKSPVWKAAAWGAVFGLVLYGVYDMTNLAIMEHWSLRLALVDMAWGTTLCATCAAGMQLGNQYFE